MKMPIFVNLTVIEESGRETVVAVATGIEIDNCWVSINDAIHQMPPLLIKKGQKLVLQIVELDEPEPVIVGK